MKVACSTLCFSRYPLDQALRAMTELEFTRIDACISYRGPHLKPEDVVADPVRCARMLKIGSALAPAALNVEFDPTLPALAFEEQFSAICKLARLLAVATLTIPASTTDVPMDVEVSRLNKLVHQAHECGLVLTVETRIGTWTELSATAVKLCEQVPGLGLTLDPSHYVCGPQQNRSYDQVFPYVKHVHLRDTGRTPDKMQVRVGQGEIEYSRIVSMLEKVHYDRILSVEIIDRPENTFPMETEVRKLKFLLESLA